VTNVGGVLAVSNDDGVHDEVLLHEAKTLVWLGQSHASWVGVKMWLERSSVVVWSWARSGVSDAEEMESCAFTRRSGMARRAWWRGRRARGGWTAGQWLVGVAGGDGGFGFVVVLELGLKKETKRREADAGGFIEAVACARG
jgi:hypothetical protein